MPDWTDTAKLRQAIHREREAFRAILARVRALVVGKDLPPEYGVDMVSSELEDRVNAEEQKRRFD